MGRRVRVSACWQLASHCAGSPETRPRIQRLADEDRDESVRTRALWALRKIDGK